jgi:translocator protein
MAVAPARLWKPVSIAALAALAVAGLGALSTDLGSWYQGLRQPAWKPPDWLFGPAWTVIFALTAVAGVVGWRHTPTREGREWLIALFAANAFLNLLWSLLFFRLKRPDWALAEVALLWLSIVVLMLALLRRSKKASLLLAPYLAWVTFAAVLNWAVVALNRPF